MRASGPLALVAGLVTIAGSCAPATSNGVYQDWSTILSQGAVGGATHTIDDVSLLVGDSPARCDSVVGPTRGLGLDALGVGVDLASGSILWVVPGSVADSSRLPLRGRVVSVDGKPLVRQRTDTTSEGVVTVTQLPEAGPVNVGVPVTLVFADGQKLTLTLHSARWLQCYWRVGAGRIVQGEAQATTQASGGADRIGASGSSMGAARSSTASYERYFVVSGRFVNGVMTQVSTNWQGR